ncbi:hypothetical protein [Paenibacillus hexagrammi]|uniref:Uncharacterized protein n=1 Tax=Paenibacillus hexagrammi TaxID=2908839 RepID=A0ABY3SIT5_9BACL|nr:hypothetical protein [Paenibacillus sp. YPD9-1]UJF33908.1 hypothetical protein L0M14_01220 [Paenibacillus sp. YPD9-1]
MKDNYQVTGPSRLHWILLINACNIGFSSLESIIDNSYWQLAVVVGILCSLTGMIVMIVMSFKKAKLHVLGESIIVGDRVFVPAELREIIVSSMHRTVWFKRKSGWSRPGYHVGKEEPFDEAAVAIRSWAYRNQVTVRTIS